MTGLRALAPWLLVAGSCASDLTLPLTAPGGLASVLVLAEEQGAQALRAYDELEPLLLPLDDEAPEGASVRLLLYSRSLSELGVRYGAVQVAAPEDPGVALAPPDLGAFRVERGADGWGALTADAAAPRLRLPRPPVDCGAARNRELLGSHDGFSVRALVATGPDTALVAGQTEDGSRTARLNEVTAQGPISRSLPAGFEPLERLASDGSVVYGIGASGALHRFDLHGNYASTSTAHVLRGLGASALGPVYGWDERGVVVRADDGRALTEPLPELAPTPFELAVHDEARMIALRGTRMFVREGRAWREVPQPPADERMRSVAIDERALYAVTSGTVHERETGAPEWRVLPDLGAFGKLRIRTPGRGVIAAMGIGGFIELRPRLDAPDVWCLVSTMTSKEIAEISFDPTRRVAFALAETTALLRIELPD